MAEKKFQDYDDFAVAPDAGDFLLVRDVSDTTDSADGTLKETTVALLRGAIVPVTLAEVSDAGALAAEDTVSTALVDNDAITYAKIQNVSAASRLLGRGDSGAGDPQEITFGSGLTMTGTELSASGAGLPTDDTTTLVQDPVDNTKRARIDVGAVAAATTRTIIMGDRDVNLGAGGTFAEASHAHATVDITSGTFADARIAESNVTQHEDAIDHDALTNFVANEHINHTNVSFTAGTGISSTGLGDLTESRTINLADTAVTPGSYTLASITVDQQGRLTAASSGSGVDTTGSLVATSTGVLAVTTASHALHKNVLLTSDQASSVFTIAKATAAGVMFAFAVQHDTCTIVIEDNAGSINGVSSATARLVNGGFVVARVMSNAGSAPVIAVIGNLVVAPTIVSSTKTFDLDDHGGTYVLDGSSGTQTFDTAVASMFAGYEVLIVNDSGANRTIAGIDASHTLSDNGFVTVTKMGASLLAVGSDGVTVLDAA